MSSGAIIWRCRTRRHCRRCRTRRHFWRRKAAVPAGSHLRLGARREQTQAQPVAVQEALRRFGCASFEALIVDDLKPGVLMSQASGSISPRRLEPPGPEIEEYMRANSRFYCAQVDDLGSCCWMPAGDRKAAKHRLENRLISGYTRESVHPCERFPMKRDSLQLLQIIETLFTIKDLDSLLENVLTEARHFVNADAGTSIWRPGTSCISALCRTTPFSGGDQGQVHLRLATGK